MSVVWDKQSLCLGNKTSGLGDQENAVDFPRKSTTSVIPYNGHYYTNVLRAAGLLKWQDLPSVLLGKIAQYLNRPGDMKGVCRDWRKFSDASYRNLFDRSLKEPVLWPYLGISAENENLNLANPEKSIEQAVKKIQSKSYLPFSEQLYRWFSLAPKLIAPICLQEKPLLCVLQNERDENLILFFNRLADELNIPGNQRPIVIDPTDNKISTQFAVNKVNAEIIREWINSNLNLLENITELNLSSLGLSEVPPEIGLLKNLKTLFIFNNKICFLSDDFGNLVKLKDLFLKNNNFRQFPKSLLRCKELEALDLSENNISEELLPTSFFLMPNLKVFGFKSGYDEGGGILKDLREKNRGVDKIEWFNLAMQAVAIGLFGHTVAAFSSCPQKIQNYAFLLLSSATFSMGAALATPFVSRSLPFKAPFSKWSQACSNMTNILNRVAYPTLLLAAFFQRYQKTT